MTKREGRGEKRGKKRETVARLKRID